MNTQTQAQAETHVRKWVNRSKPARLIRRCLGAGVVVFGTFYMLFGDLYPVLN